MSECGTTTKKVKKVIKDFKNMNVDGLIIQPVEQEIYNEDLLEMKINRFPFVLIDTYLPGIETNFVVADNVKGGKIATEYLIEMGHRNIAVCTSVGSPIQTQTTTDRLKGYKQVLEEHDIPFRKEFVINGPVGDCDYYTNSTNLIRMIKNKEITAVIAHCSRISTLLYQTFCEEKIRVPDDVSILSFDNPTPGLGDMSFFTYIDQHEREIGEQAAEILWDIITTGKQDSITEKVMPVSLVERSSVKKCSING